MSTIAITNSGFGAAAEETNPTPLAGHSYHGEAFNEGPRQKAILMPGMGNVLFNITCKDNNTQAFFNQGIAALHGFWYLEAERAFRQAAAIEPEVAMCYWGMAMSNANNVDRARGFIAEAVKRREQASPREQLYIDALDQYLKKPEGDENDDQRKRRESDYIRNLEKILNQFPDDIEAKAFLVVQLWTATRNGLPITSHHAVNALLGEIFAANPLHPAHHYRIHLWDSERAENALHSSAMCGPSLPGIAHMWHMPGHIYSKLHRYHDAVWQQDASARVDHAHMIRTRLMPDQIHNFAHNNEWLTRNLLYLGRVEEAVSQARNLWSLPRHPVYNSLESRGSYRYGRTRLLQTFTEYELWERLLTEANGPYLPVTNDRGLDYERLAWMTVAHHMLGQTKQAKQLDRQLRRELANLDLEQVAIEEKQDAIEEAKAAGQEVVPADTAKDDDSSDSLANSPLPDDPEKLKKRAQRNTSLITELKQWIALGNAAAAVHAKDVAKYKETIANAGRIDDTLKQSWLMQAGEVNEAITELEKITQDSNNENQVRPLAVLVDALWRANRHDDAVAKFQLLRSVAGTADLQTPLLVRLQPVADKAGVGGDWRIPPTPATDIGERPNLDSLGPIRWSPYVAPQWSAQQADGNPVTSDVYSGKPRVVIFYLGFGCLHCVEQLTAFKPLTDKFREQGIEIVGISNEPLADFQKGMSRYEEEIPFTLLVDSSQNAFHEFLCWDDFENQPLHGTFLVDAQGRVRWQDIGHEPFTKAEFLLEEARRLLALPDE
jgi:peroxiredoxin